MEEENMTTDEVATLLVQLYADYKYRMTNAGYGGFIKEDYSKAVAIAIRMLTD